jgi:hypothetical protein
MKIPAGLQVLQPGRKVKKPTPGIALMGRLRNASYDE